MASDGPQLPVKEQKDSGRAGLPPADTVQPRSIVSLDPDETILAKFAMRGTQGVMPKTKKGFGLRGLPFAKEPVNREDFIDATGATRNDFMECADVPGCPFSFGWATIDAMKNDPFFGGLSALVVNQPDCPASKYVWSEYFGPEGRVRKENLYLVFFDKSAVKAEADESLARRHHKMKSLMPKEFRTGSGQGDVQIEQTVKVTEIPVQMAPAKGN